jgi:hypothetical protein
VRQGICQRGATKRQGERAPGQICSDTWAKHIVKVKVRDLETVFNGAIRALARAGVFGAKVTGMMDGTDLETTERYVGCGQVTRQVRREDKQGRMYEIAVTVYGWKVLLLIDAVTKIPLAVKVGPIDAHETHWTRALVTQARTERLTTEVVGITGLTPEDPYGTAEHRCHANRRDFQPNLLNAVVVRQRHGRDYGLGGKTVFLTNASVQQPLQPFDDDDDRSLIENCCMKEAKQPWELGHPPQKSERAVRVRVVFTMLLFALATAYRLQGEQAATVGEPVGWQRWRRQRLEHTRNLVIVFAQGACGIFHLAEYSRLSGVELKDVPPGLGTLPEILAKYGLRVHG